MSLVKPVIRQPVREYFIPGRYKKINGSPSQQTANPPISQRKKKKVFTHHCQLSVNRCYQLPPFIALKLRLNLLNITAKGPRVPILS